ncbi:DsbA family protein [uncultured Imperialibacter sp.]|uniref:DsbA family protein n=1 Tax=uncultured Imperialibacter sp. TaxID=1672639 RepID=UPI0030D906D6|tara:strand:- start:143384 stop:144028 length:645 start_codon:yes stop_codon:yes gene_type:complete
MKKDTIIYIFDPLCGWCYGFSGTIVDLFNKRKDEFNFEVISGGMVTGTRIAPFSSMHGYISGAYKRVEEMTGAKFGEPYLNDLLPSDMQMNSEPPSRALVTFRSFLPDQVVPFAHALQKKQYLEGRDFADNTVYEELAAQFGLDPKAFIEKFESEEMKYQTTQDFQWSNSAGVKGFPTVVLKNDQGYYLVSNGFRPLDEVEKVIETIQGMAKEA